MNLGRQHHINTIKARIARDQATLARLANEPIQNFETAHRIIAAVCDLFDVTTAELQGPTKPWRICWPRFLAIYLIYKHTKYTHEQIAGLFNRSYGSISVALSRTQKHIDTDPKAALNLSVLESAIKRTA